MIIYQYRSDYVLFRSALQILLDACENYGKLWCLIYNPSKSKTMVFGKGNPCQSLSMYGNKLEFVDQYKYLGVTVVAGNTIKFSSLKPLIKFKRSANTILNVRFKPSENVLMKLLYTMCVPILIYACDAIEYSSSQMHSLTVALNDCIRCIFTYNRWESVRYLRMSFGYPSLTKIFNRRAASFRERIPMIRNETLGRLVTLMSKL